MGIMDRESGEISFHDVVLEKDEGNRPETTLEGLSSLKTVRENGHITAGNASQLSDGAAACVIMEASLAEKRGLQPLGYYRGTAVAGCEPDEMGFWSCVRQYVVCTMCIGVGQGAASLFEVT